MYQRKLNSPTDEPVKGNNNFKIILAAALVVLSVILFYFFAVTESNDDIEPAEDVIKKPLNTDVLAKGIDSVISSFGIQKSWIKDNSVNHKESSREKESPEFSREVIIPQDLLTIDLNYELTNYLRSHSYKTTVSEEPKSRNLSVNIYRADDTSKKLTGFIKFIYSDSVKRKSADVCIVLDSIEYYTLNEVQYILSSAETYSVILPLRNDKADYQLNIIEAKKDYLLEFSAGDENDVAADFKEGMNDNSVRTKVKSAAVNFPGAGAVILKGNKSVAGFMESVGSEFAKNDIIVLSDTVFTEFRKGESVVNSLFENIISNTISGKKNIIYKINLSPQEFKDFEKKVYGMKKLGYRFLTFRGIMKSSSKAKG